MAVNKSRDMPDMGLRVAKVREARGMTQEDRKASVEMAYNVCSFELPVSLESMAEYMGVSVRCARDRIKECGNEYTIKGGYVVKAEKAGSTEIGK